MTGSAVFFTQIVGLSAAQVGLGLTCAGVAAFLAAVPMGKLVDRFGPKKMWALSATGQAAMFCLWPFIEGFPGYLGMAVGMEVIGALGGAAVNYAFLEHFQDVARGHFTVRRLERVYGKDFIQKEYERLADNR